MPRTVFHRRFGAPVAQDDLLRVERVIAFARLLVSAIALPTIWQDPTDPARYASLTYTIVITYVAASICALTWLGIRTRLLPGEAVLAHTGDVTVATALTLFVYALMVAAYRWGLFETFFTTATAAVLILVEAILLDGYRIGFTSEHLEGEFVINRLIMRVFYVGSSECALHRLGQHHRIDLRHGIAWTYDRFLANQAQKVTATSAV